MIKRIVFALYLFLCATLVFSQGIPKKGVQEFVNYLLSHKSELNYENFEKVESEKGIEIKIICRNGTQEKLIQVVDEYAFLNYNLSRLSDGAVVFSGVFSKGTPQPAETQKVKCPRTVKVNAEKITLESFDEYGDFSGTVKLSVQKIIAPISGTVIEWNVASGQAVQAGDILAVVEGASADEVKTLEEEAAKAKKILDARLNWKEKSERAISQAEEKYNEALKLYEEKKALLAVAVTAPFAGVVQEQAAASGQTVSRDDLLLTLENIDRAEISITAGEDSGLFSEGDFQEIVCDRSEQRINSRVMDISGGKVLLVSTGIKGRLQTGDMVTFRRLKKHLNQAVVIPSEWIQKDEIGQYVFVVDVRQARQRYITTGPTDKGKTLVRVGITEENEVITSGFECLKEGKRIRVLKTGGKPTKAVPVKAQEKPQEKPVVKKEEKKRPEKIKEPGEPEEEQPRFRIGLVFGRFSVNDEGLGDFYGHKWSNIPGIEASVHIKSNIDVWASYKVYNQTTQTSFFENEVKFRLNPLLLGIRYRLSGLAPFSKVKYLEPFVGAGLNFYSYSEKIAGNTELENTKGSTTGFHIQAGSYVSIYKGFIGSVFLRINMVSKTLTENHPDDVEKLKLGGVEFGIGLHYRF